MPLPHKKAMFNFFLLLLISPIVQAKEVALTFDDAPGEVTLHFTPEERTNKLLAALSALNVPPVIIFANPCNGQGLETNLPLLKKFKQAGHLIGNHTCTHPRLDDVGFEKFTADTRKAEALMEDLLFSPKLFRFPTFNEGKNPATRDRMRAWLKDNHYRNIPSSIDNEDPIFSFKLNQAKEQGRKINYGKVRALFLDHILTGMDFYEKLGRETLGYSPKHIILLHQKDATVLFLESLVKELRAKGWKIISAENAIQDPLYSLEPLNTNSTYGLLSQVAAEKSGNFMPYYDFAKLKQQLNKILGIGK